MSEKIQTIGYKYVVCLIIHVYMYSVLGQKNIN